MTNQRPDWDDLPRKEWECIFCGAINSDEDAECQFCDGPPSREEWEADHKIDQRKHER
jgi:hypothetical protein